MFESYYEIEKMVLEQSKDLRRIRSPLERGRSRAIRMNPLTIICLLIISSCAITPLIRTSIDSSRLNDGVYQGFYEGGLNSALVEVSIEDQKILDVTILEHDTLMGKKAEDIIIGEILEAQSTEVDAVSGATNSSHVIINAAQIALEKAYRE